jgi:hypothetical protein
MERELVERARRREVQAFDQLVAGRLDRMLHTAMALNGIGLIDQSSP